MAERDFLFEKIQEICQVAKKEGSQNATVHRLIAEIYEAGIPYDFDRMTAWYRVSALEGDIKSQYRYAMKIFNHRQIDYFTEAMEMLTKSAESGYFEAIHEIVIRDEPNRLKWLQKLVDMGDSKATYALAVLNIKKGEDVDKVVDLLNIYINKVWVGIRYASAHHYLGYIYKRFLNDEKKAFYHYEKTVVLLGVKNTLRYPNEEWITCYLQKEIDGNEVYTTLGDMYFYGRGTEQNYKKAYPLYMKSASKGCGHSLYQLSQMYLLGLGVEIDSSQAIEFCKKALEAGDTDAQFDMGKGAYKAGDEENSIKYLELAGNKNHVGACVLLGLIYFRHGIAIHPNSYKWFCKARELMTEPIPEMHYHLAYMYETGKCVEKNYEVAINHWQGFINIPAYRRKECQRRTPPFGCLDDKILYHFNYDLEEVKKNYNTAYRCLLMLTKHHNPRAFYTLAWMAWYGYGPVNDKKEAFNWYCQALLNDKTDMLKGLRNELKGFENELTVHQLKQRDDDKEVREKYRESEKQLVEMKGMIEELKKKVEGLSGKGEKIEMINVDM